MLCPHILPALGATRADRLTAVHLERTYGLWRNKTSRQADGGLSETTVKHLHDLIRLGLNFAKRRRLVGRNMAMEIEDPPTKDRKEMSVLCADDLVRLLDFARKPSKSIRCAKCGS